MRAAPAPTGSLVLHAAQRAWRVGEEIPLAVARPDGGPVGSCHVDCPGAEISAAAGSPAESRWRLRLTRPGFFPLQFAAAHDGVRRDGRDYLVATDPAMPPPETEAGYYVFLGCGDYPIITGRETHELAAWTLAQWQELVAWMGAHGMNRLWVLVNGYTLAYPSRRHPGLCDRHARNVTDNFLRELIGFGHAHGVKTYLMLTTDGHGRDFVRAHPETARLNAEGRPCVHHGLALEHPATRRYIFDVLDEVLALYPNADGVAVHPTESDPDRFNRETLAAYRDDTGGDLRAAAKAERYAWYNRAFARFLAEFGARCRRHRADLDLVMANCWWQDDHVAINRAELPPEWRIAVWYYGWEDVAPQPWPIHRWTDAFGPERILFLPTSQSYLFPEDHARVMDRHVGTDRLVSTALALGIRHTMYFAGWEILAPESRLLDVALVRHPTLDWLPPAERRGALPRLYSDYFGLRADAVRPAR